LRQRGSAPRPRQRHRLALDCDVDELQLKQLKKRSDLKDQIAKLESQLIPDLNA
jgi:hypothetical protein